MQEHDRAARSQFRACILTSVHPALDTRVFHKEARALAKAGYRVSLLAQYHENVCLEGVAIHALPLWSARGRRPILWWLILLRALRARADVYHIHDPELIPLALLLQTLSGRPVVYDAHEYYGDEVRTRLWIPAPLRNAAGWLTERIEKAAARRLAAVVTVNEHMNAGFLRVQPRSIAVHNYPPPEYFGEPSPAEREPLVVYVGVLTRDRGIETIYEAGCLLRARFPALRISVAGPIDWSGVSEAIPRDAATWRERAGVSFLGTVPQREIPALLGRASVGWIPFLATPNNVRSTPNKLLEYMAAALPVVASDVGYMHAIVGEADCGRLAAAGDAAAHAEQIAWLLENPAAAEGMGASGRSAVLARYTWTSEGARLVALYDELTSGTKKHGAVRTAPGGP